MSFTKHCAIQFLILVNFSCDLHLVPHNILLCMQQLVYIILVKWISHQTLKFTKS